MKTLRSLRERSCRTVDAVARQRLRQVLDELAAEFERALLADRRTHAPKIGRGRGRDRWELRNGPWVAG